MTLQRQLGLAAAGLTLSVAALAQSASNGQTLYNKVIVTGQNSCAASACHGSSPSRRLNKIQLGVSASTLKNAVSGVTEMRFLAGHVSDAEFNDLAAYIASTAGGTASYLAVTAAPALALSAGSIAFGNVTVGNTSTLRTVTLTNSGTAALSIGTLAASPSVFALTHDCPLSPATLAVGSACTLSLSFTPTTAGASSGSVAITTNATPASASIALSGSGTTAPAPLLAWSGSVTALSFAATTVGTPSAAQTVTLLNQGSSTANLSTVTLSGTDAADFTLGGSCGAGSSLPAGGNCTVTVTFDPASAGSKTASLQVSSSNASNPGNVSLAGTAVAAPAGSGGSTGTGGSTSSAGTVSGASANSNVGAGGCSLVAPHQVTPTDPTLWALLLGAVAVLLWRLRERRGRRT